jgi:phage gp36-like protein
VTTQRYADEADLVPEVFSQATADLFTSDERLRALTNASAEADAELNRRYTLPLAAWDDATRRHVAVMAGYELLSGKPGYDSADEGSSLKTRAAAARAWFKRVGDGTLSPPEIVDSTPDVDEAGPFVVTNTRRRWLR